MGFYVNKNTKYNDQKRYNLPASLHVVLEVLAFSLHSHACWPLGLENLRPALKDYEMKNSYRASATLERTG